MHIATSKGFESVTEQLIVAPSNARIFGCSGERCLPILCRNVYVAASFNQLLREGSMPIVGREVERRAPILVLKIH